MSETVCPRCQSGEIATECSGRAYAVLWTLICAPLLALAGALLMLPDAGAGALLLSPPLAPVLDVARIVGGIGSVLAAIVPGLLLLRCDRRHHVCRHCGHRWLDAPASHLPDVAAARTDEPGQPPCDATHHSSTEHRRLRFASYRVNADEGRVCEMTDLIPPYGGRLVNLLVPEEERAELRAYAGTLPSLQLSERSVCDLELLATGGFSPLDRFMDRADYGGCLHAMRLASGHLFPVPVTLPVDPDLALVEGQDVALRDARNNILATMTVEQVYPWSLEEEAKAVYETLDTRHPTVAEMHRWPRANVSGALRVLELPGRHDFASLRLTPAQTRARLESLGYANVVAFQTRNPLHRVHEELTRRAADDVGGVLLIHPVVGMTKPGDVDHYTRVRTYQAMVERYYDPDRVLLSLLPLAMRMGGPREALWHALIRRNYGANHLIVGRDHAGPGLDSEGRPFYGPYAAQELVEAHSAELGVTVVPFRMLVYLPQEERYEEVSRVPEGVLTADISGTQVRDDYLGRGRALPEWFTRPEVADILAQAYPPRHKQGLCVWFTGLSGAGKSTTAEILTVLFQERGRQVTLLDGDVVRTHLSKGLGFSREDRDTNIRRIAFVAAEIVRHGGVAICAAVSPYRSTRQEARNMVGSDRFVEVFVDTPLEICEQRDIKGLYAKARRGELTGFTGIDDPYEAPANAEITLDTVQCAPEFNARRILDFVAQRGFVVHGREA